MLPAQKQLRCGSTISKGDDGTIITVRTDGSTTLETPGEQCMLVMPSGRPDLLQSFKPQCAAAAGDAYIPSPYEDDYEIKPDGFNADLSANTTGAIYY